MIRSAVRAAGPERTPGCWKSWLAESRFAETWLAETWLAETRVAETWLAET